MELLEYKIVPDAKFAGLPRHFVPRNDFVQLALRGRHIWTPKLSQLEKLKKNSFWDNIKKLSYIRHLKCHNGFCILL